MYKHILVPTDGSRLSEKAAGAAIRLAKALGARVTAFHVASDAPALELEAWAHRDPGFREHLRTFFENLAATYLRTVKDLAIKADVDCECHYAWGSQPYALILTAAREHRCDLIFMASHGRGAADAAVLGSETGKVVVLSPIPVLVHHEDARPGA